MAEETTKKVRTCPHCCTLISTGEDLADTHKTKKRSEKEYKDLMNRLKRIEGQIRGIEKMVEEDRYCIDILMQSSAVSAAMNAFNRELLERHIRGCVADNIREGSEEEAGEVIEELVATVQRMMKN